MEEDVLEGRAAHQRGQRLDATRVHDRGGLVTVVGVDQEPVGQHLDALADAGHLLGVVLVVLGVEAQLEDLAGGVLLDELAG